MSTTVQTEIRPFHVDIPEEQIDNLRRRIAARRWPSKELVQDRSQGVQLATLQELAHYWTTQYDFGRVEARLNALPQSVTEIDGVDIHFIHVRSQHEDALPLIMTHGWPGSVMEMIDSVGPLTDPTAHGGSAEDAFHLLVPSLPGYGFSGEPVEVGWDLGRTARPGPSLCAASATAATWRRWRGLRGRSRRPIKLLGVFRTGERTLSSCVGQCSRMSPEGDGSVGSIAVEVSVG
jgi:pimeloyl-ACP methyl ester carboxylesterase